MKDTDNLFEDDIYWCKECDIFISIKQVRPAFTTKSFDHCGNCECFPAIIPDGYEHDHHLFGEDRTEQHKVQRIDITKALNKILWIIGGRKEGAFAL